MKLQTGAPGVRGPRESHLMSVLLVLFLLTAALLVPRLALWPTAFLCSHIHPTLSIVPTLCRGKAERRSPLEQADGGSVSYGEDTP